MNSKLVNELLNTSVEYQDDEVETASPKDLRTTDSSLSQEEVLQRFHGVVGVQPVGAHPEAPDKLEELASEGTIKCLDGDRVWVVAEVVDFKPRYRYEGYTEEGILLKDVKLRDFGVLLKERLWLTHGVWSRDLRVGDVIVFKARLVNGGLKNPNNVRLIESSPRPPRQKGGTPGAGDRGIQLEMF